jgi:hypothetical protein
MPIKLKWTDAQDTRIRQMRTEGATWDTIAAALGLSSSTIIERGRRIGARPPPPDFIPPPDDPHRAPLPAGHSRTWGLMNAGTVLADEAYPMPECLADPFALRRRASRLRRTER